MYSILPAFVAILFLFFGLYVLHEKGLTKISSAFLILCLTTFFWQAAWAVLFQVENAQVAIPVIKVGWFLILFLPTSLYHFLVQITRQDGDQRWVSVSYVISGILAVLLISTHWVIDGYYEFFWGFYPKAGPLHSVHVLQTTVVVLRGLYITYKKQQVVQAGEKTKLQFCIISILIYFFAALDYLCNYGYEFYPPGVLFTTVSLGLIAIATAKFHVLDDSKALAASIAHEMRTPLATLGLQIEILSRHIPDLVRGYNRAVDEKLIEPTIPVNVQQEILKISGSMASQVVHTNYSIDSLMTMTSDYQLDKKDFSPILIRDCITNAISRMPNQPQLAKLIDLQLSDNFTIHGSMDFLGFVFINLIKNGIDATKAESSPKITIRTYSRGKAHFVECEDNGSGIDENILPHIFDTFFTTKVRGRNSGIGLSFCRNVMRASGGDIKCHSIKGEFTRFTLIFRATPPSKPASKSQSSTTPDSSLL
ncbi:sensor histidine kinase [Aurantivibrio plasticivorans]